MALSKIDLDKAGVTGTLPTSNLDTVGVAQGGTGITSGTTDQFLKFTGTTTLASAADNAGSLVHIASASTTSNVSTVDINGCFSATYRNYLLIFDYTPSENGANPRIRFKDTSNNAITSSNYGYAFSGLDFGGGAENSVGNNDDSAIQPGQGTANNENTDFPAVSGVFHILNPFSSSNNLNFMGSVLNRGNNGEFRQYSGAGRFALQTQIGGLQFFFGSGNVNNLTAKVYGIVDS